MMKKLTKLTKTLLVAAGLCVGQSAWAYTIPTGMEVKEVLLGTLSNGDVTAETFDEDGATVPSFTNPGGFTITDALPTDQWQSCASNLSGKALRLGSRSTHEIDFTSTVTSGKVVFAADFYIGTHQKIIKIIDNDNNVVARFVYPDKNSSGRVYGTQYLYVDVDGEAVFSSTPSINDTYQGTRNREYQIVELVFDLDAKTISYSGKVMDRRNSADGWKSDNATITLSKDITIKGLVIDASGVGNNTYYAYFDNMKLYSVGNAAGTYNYTINAVAGETVIKQIASGNATSGSDFGAYIPEVIYYNDQYYRLDDNDISTYYANFTMGDADAVKNVNYSLDTSITAFWECENLSYVGHSWYSGGAKNNDSECSNGAAICPYSGTSNGIITNSTIEKGVYNITIKPCRWGDLTTTYTLQYSTDNSTWTDIESVSFAANSNDAYVADYVLIPGDSYLRLLSPSSTPRHSLDYILVEKKADITDANNEFVGAFDFTTGYLGASSSSITLKPGDSYTYQFVNHYNGGSSWLNWHLPVKKANGDNVLVLRADWYEDINGSNVAEHQRGFSTTSGNYWDFVPSKIDGATVEMTVTFTTDKKFVMTSTNTATDGTKWTYNFTSDNGNNVDLTGESYLTVALSVNTAWLEVLSTEQTALGLTTTAAGLGWATLYTDKALDFSEASGLTAYTATLDESTNTVTLTEVSNIPANTGVVLKSETTNANTTYAIPVIASSGTGQGSLTGSVTESLTYSESAEKDYYFLAINDEQEAQFTKLTSGTIAAGKAYLEVTKGGARSLRVVFADETQGIESVSANAVNSDDCYDIQGRRVAQPQKGLYIKNGKKVVMK